MRYRVLYVDSLVGVNGNELFLNYSDTFNSVDAARAYKQEIDKYVFISFIIELDMHEFSTYKIVR